ncbi:phosphatidate cytidylyltransferase [Luminiphilus syltensis]|uniref:phosphatidate cytidylyltransferase n=1 Tax=Luminiphilus syltensis TaxID=1341119 RepID=UPI00031A86EC|nr:phosphatidate cytidylyltransferase [Luminiphilus syltensis]
MLRKRVLTALVLVALFLSAVIYLPLPLLALFFALVAAAGAWEWAALAGWTRPMLRTFYSVLLLMLTVSLWFWVDLGGKPTASDVQPFLGSAGLMWCVYLLFVESFPGTARFWRHPAVRTLMGWAVLGFAWLAVVYLMTLQHGAILLVLMVIVVASADIGAFFTGRSFGKHKLAPSVSPGKTWEGLWGGLACVIVVAVVVALNLPKAYTHIGIESIIIIGLATAGASVLGDLTVSMVKRECAVKDSGTLLPGHGGLLDRLDSICGAAPIFALSLVLVGF